MNMKKNAFRIIAPVLALTMAASSFAYADGTNAKVPSDVAGTSAETAVAALMETGAISGDTDGLFHPQANLTRAQVCKMLVTLIDPPKSVLTGTATQSAASSGFTDLAGASWAKSYIDYAAVNKIAMGYGDKTFKPSGDVTLAELLTFTVRACGYTDSNLTGTWPENYIKKAEDLKLFDGIDIAGSDKMSSAELADTLKTTLATKEQAALVLYNAVSAIVKYEEPATEWTLKTAAAAVSKGGLSFAKSGSFDANLTSYDDKPLADDVYVLTYGSRGDYTDSMSFSAKLSEYDVENVYKYKNVTTPAYYKLENGEITLIVLPYNVGFSGKVYCVINATDGITTNYSGDSVSEYETLSAMKEITWLAAKGLDASALAKKDFLDGQVYELYTKKGVVQSVAGVGDTGKKNSSFKELTNGWETIKDTEADRNLVLIEHEDGTTEWMEISPNASIYVLDTDDEAYEIGSASKIKKNAEVRLYNIAEDEDEEMAYIVVVKQR